MSSSYTLCLDVGNSNLYAGLYDDAGNIQTRFRKVSFAGASADEYGIFLRSVLRENGFDPAEVKRIGLCSVVPDTIYSIRRACQKYFNAEPFILRSGVKTGLQINYRNPIEVGADRIANAIAACKRHPKKDLVVVDFGTATTFDVVSADKRYLGGAIAPGLRISMEALEEKTARLPVVEIAVPQQVCGRSTIESIQSGLFFGHLGMVKEMVARIRVECFEDRKPVVIATGGFSHLFSESGVFDEILGDLVLEGLREAMLMNPGEAE